VLAQSILQATAKLSVTATATSVSSTAAAAAPVPVPTATPARSYVAPMLRKAPPVSAGPPPPAQQLQQIDESLYSRQLLVLGSESSTEAAKDNERKEAIEEKKRQLSQELEKAKLVLESEQRERAESSKSMNFIKQKVTADRPAMKNVFAEVSVSVPIRTMSGRTFVRPTEKEADKDKDKEKEKEKEKKKDKKKAQDDNFSEDKVTELETQSQILRLEMELKAAQNMLQKKTQPDQSRIVAVIPPKYLLLYRNLLDQSCTPSLRFLHL
jgi:hypothetical protein